MASYFYLMSSLPLLSSEGVMPFSYEEFLKSCENTVSAKTFSLLSGLTLDSENGPLIKEWADYYGEFSREMSYQRKKRLGIPADVPYPRMEKTVKAVSAALNDDDPLNAEKQLLSEHFSKLDELIGTHTFDDQALFGYALKLKLLQRKTVFDHDEGKRESERIFDILYKKIIDFE